MADIIIKRKHNLDFASARTQAKAWLASAKADFGVNANYIEGDSEDSAHIKMMGVDGRAILRGDEIIFEANLGFLAKPMKSSIERGISEGLDKFFT